MKIQVRHGDESYVIDVMDENEAKWLLQDEIDAILTTVKENEDDTTTEDLPSR